MQRRVARRHGFSLVFQLPFHPITNEGVAHLVQGYYDSLAPDDRPTGSAAEYIHRVIWGVFDRQDHIDQVIEKFLRGWDIGRISKVDLAIMRLCIYEMLCEEDVPVATAVNEAVELAKAFGTDDSPSFVNGVLGNVSRSMK